MPIYEYQAVNKGRACPKCREVFEILKEVRKVISWCHSAVTETSDAALGVERQIKDYEQAGMWSHAAELADKHSEKTKDKALKMRALENYKKAGYDADSLAKHVKSDND